MTANRVVRNALSAVLLAAVIAACDGGSAASASSQGGAHARVGASSTVSMLKGELATASGRSLTITERTGRRHTLRLTRRAQAWEPSWSYDGRWLSFFEVPSSYPVAGSSGALWVAAPEGDEALVVERASEAEWDPRTDQLAFVDLGHLELATLHSHRSHLPPLRAFGRVDSFAWSPTGRELAAGTVAAGSAARSGAEASLLIVPADGGNVHVVARSRNYGFDVDSWWPDGRGILYWQDSGFSASIAADGLPLVSRALRAGTARTLATTLPYSQWVAWSRTGREVAIVAGRDRVVWNGVKHVMVCQVPAGRCHDVTQPTGTTSTDPAWGRGGRLFAFRSTGTGSYTMTGPPTIGGLSSTPPFSWRVGQAWANAGSVRVVTARGSDETASRAVGGASGGQSPTPTSAGLFFVRSGDLWLLGTGSPTPVRLTGRLGPFGTHDPGYYGEDDWAATFAWHA